MERGRREGGEAPSRRAVASAAAVAAVATREFRSSAARVVFFAVAASRFGTLFSRRSGVEKRHV